MLFSILYAEPLPPKKKDKKLRWPHYKMKKNYFIDFLEELDILSNLLIKYGK